MILQNCRLAAARCAEQNERFAFGNIEIDVFEHAGLSKALADAEHTGGDRRARTPVRKSDISWTAL